MLVLDQRLGQRRFAVDDVDQVIDHPAFAARDQVEVTQTDVEVDDGRLEAAQGEAGRNWRWWWSCLRHPCPKFDNDASHESVSE